MTVDKTKELIQKKFNSFLQSLTETEFTELQKELMNNVASCIYRICIAYEREAMRRDDEKIKQLWNKNESNGSSI